MISSTTWVFVGLLCGRELAMATITGKEKFRTAFPLVTKDFIKMMIGLGASVAVVLGNSLCNCTPTDYTKKINNYIRKTNTRRNGYLKKV